MEKCLNSRPDPGVPHESEAGRTLWLAALNPAVLEVVRRAGLADRLGRERLLFNAREVIRRYREQYPETQV